MLENPANGEGFRGDKIDKVYLPKDEYIHKMENGKMITYCTLRQKALHTIGLNSYGRPYTRHGRRFYRPYRNYFGGHDKDLDRLVDAGYMTFVDDFYSFNRAGLDWLGEQLNIYIYNEKD